MRKGLGWQENLVAFGGKGTAWKHSILNFFVLIDFGHIPAPLRVSSLVAGRGPWMHPDC